VQEARDNDKKEEKRESACSKTRSEYSFKKKALVVSKKNKMDKKNGVHPTLLLQALGRFQKLEEKASNRVRSQRGID